MLPVGRIPGLREEEVPSLRGYPLGAEMCWVAGEGSKETSKGWSEELLQGRGLV